MQTLLIAVVAGLGMGSVYALVALSFNLVYSSTGYFHLGMGAFVTLGAVMSYQLRVVNELPYVLIVLIVAVMGAAVGAASELIAVRPIRGRSKHDHNAVLVSTFAVLTFVGAAVALSFSSDALRVPPYWEGSPFVIGDVPIRRVFVVMIAALIVTAVILEVVMRFTDTGRLLRAANEDSTGVELLGVGVDRVVIATFAIAGLIAAIAGLLVAPVSFASAHVGTDLLLYGFAAIAVGGFGSYIGSIVGALMVGLVTTIAPIFLATEYTRPLILLAVVAVLLIRPQGLLGHKELRSV